MMHEEVHQGAGQEDQKRQEVQCVLSMIGKQQQNQAECGGDNQPEQIDRNSHGPPVL